MSDYFVETLMLYGALGGAATNLVVVGGWGTEAGAVVMALFAFFAVAFNLYPDE